MEARARRFQQLSVEEVMAEMNKERHEAIEIKNALRFYDKLSNRKKTNREIAKSAGLSVYTVNQYRSFLLKNNLLEYGKTDMPNLGKIKKLEVRKIGNSTYGIVYLNLGTLKSARVNPENDNFFTVKPDYRKITLNF